MEKKDYNNFVKSMELSHNWYNDDKLTSEIRYGLFEPSNELIIEFMEKLELGGYTYLAEVIRGCEYTKNVDLLYILTEFMLARYKKLNRHTMKERLERIKEIESKYEGKSLYNYHTDSYNSNKISFLVDALKTGMITIEADGTIKSPFIKEDHGFKVDPDIIFMLDVSYQACVIKEAIDDGKIIVIEGMDFLKPEKPNEKKYKK